MATYNTPEPAPKPDDMTDAEFEFRRQVYRFYWHGGREPDADYLRRELSITLFPGHYGMAGAVLSINGSPSRLVMVIVGPSKHNAAIFILEQWGRSRLISKPGPTPTPKSKLPLVAAIWRLLNERGYIGEYGNFRTPEGSTGGGLDMAVWGDVLKGLG